MACCGLDGRVRKRASLSDVELQFKLNRNVLTINGTHYAKKKFNIKIKKYRFLHENIYLYLWLPY